jgi:hypothetical protein
MAANADALCAWKCACNLRIDGVNGSTGRDAAEKSLKSLEFVWIFARIRGAEASG